MTHLNRGLCPFCFCLMPTCVCTHTHLIIHSILLPNDAASRRQSHGPLLLHRKTCPKVSNLVHTYQACESYPLTANELHTSTYPFEQNPKCALRRAATSPANNSRTYIQAKATPLWARSSTPRPLTAITAVPYMSIHCCSTRPFSRHKHCITNRGGILSEPQIWTATVDIVTVLFSHRLLFKVVSPKSTCHSIE